MSKLKTPSLKEKVAVYEAFFHRVNFHRNLTMNEKAIIKLLEIADAWSWAHRSGNGEYSEAEKQQHINSAFEKMKTLP